MQCELEPRSKSVDSVARDRPEEEHGARHKRQAKDRPDPDHEHDSDPEKEPAPAKPV